MGSRVFVELSRCLTVWLALTACSRTHSPETVSQEFLDSYYIERDHQKALAVVMGAAEDRVRNEAKLVEEGRSAGVSTSAVQPRVYYKLKQKGTTGGDNTLLYALTIDSAGVQLKKEVRLQVRKLRDRDYRVSYFTETDLPSH